MKIPAIGFIGWSGTGKTTFIEKLIPVLKNRGLRVAVIKRDGHDFQMDKEGKDTFRFTKAGADVVAISNLKHSALLNNRPEDLRSLLETICGVDIIIAEGWQECDIPLIEVHRSSFDRLRSPEPNNLIAIITDEKLPLEIPQFGLEDIEPAADFIMSVLSLSDPCQQEYRAIVSGKTPASSSVTVTVNGKTIPMVPFVQDIVREVNVAVLGTLRDVDLPCRSQIKIEISL